ncbi:MAG: hypothetical protein ACOC95_04980 [Planctomycetota bacterium]
MALARQAVLIGWAGRDITPEQPGVLAGQHYGRTSKFVHDPVTATALAISSADEAERAVLVSIDAVGVADYTWRQAIAAIAEACPEISAAAVCLNATHTHSAPGQHPRTYPIPEGAITPKAYSDFVAARVAEAVKEAWEVRQPGQIGWGLAHAAFAHNRISLYSDGRAQMYGPTDTESFRGFQAGEESAVQLIATTDEAGTLTGMIVNVACPSQCSEHSEFITADYWGDVRAELRRRHGKELFILPQCAAAGDLSPHLRRHRRAEERMLRLQDALPTGEVDRGTFEMARRGVIARRIADAIDEMLPLVRGDLRKEVEFAHRCRTVDLPMRVVTQAERDNAAEKAAFHRETMAQLEPDPDNHEYTMHRTQATRHERVAERHANQGASPVLKMPLHAIRLGDVAIVTNRFELYHDYEARIEARSPAVQTFVVQLAGAGTYLPTRRAVAGASYGAGIESNLVGPDGGDVLVETSLDVINRLFQA